MTITKLVNEYKEKISIEDQIILNCTHSIRTLRKQNLSTRDYVNESSPHVTDRRISEAKRQCYIQAIVDIESLSI